MASASKRVCVDVFADQEDIDFIFGPEENPEGMSSDEESDLDRQLGSIHSEESRWAINKLSIEH